MQAGVELKVLEDRLSQLLERRKAILGHVRRLRRGQRLPVADSGLITHRDIWQAMVRCFGYLDS